MTVREPEKAKDTFDALLALFTRGLLKPIIYPEVSLLHITILLVA